jgi:hypothetical protein
VHAREGAAGTQFITTQFTCFTGTKVQILTPEELQEKMLAWERDKEVLERGLLDSNIRRVKVEALSY